jgi:hypothetical protein
MVEQPTRRRDEDVKTAPRLRCLRRQPDAAEQRQRGRASVDDAGKPSMNRTEFSFRPRGRLPFDAVTGLSASRMAGSPLAQHVRSGIFPYAC